MSFTIKSLEWQEPTSRTNGCWTAECILGTFSVAFDDGWHACLEDGLRWEWEPDQDPRSYHGPWPAQKACQEFLDARIRSAITPTPAGEGMVVVPREPTQQMLDEGSDAQMLYGHPRKVWQAMVAAAAPQGAKP